MPAGVRFVTSASMLAAIAVGLLAACAGIPTTPSVMVLPGSGRPFEEFQADDASCRRSATQAVQAATDSAIPLQYRFDMTYMQCMYARGHQIPTLGGRSGYTAAPASPPPTGPDDTPAPPAGTPPPAPPSPTR